MRAPTVIRKILGELASKLASSEPVDFVCADCERWARCGLASSDDCVFRAEQIARGDWQMRRRVKALSLAMGWCPPGRANT
jgi:hypothetical protein